jgi:hypothetical protein
MTTSNTKPEQEMRHIWDDSDDSRCRCCGAKDWMNVPGCTPRGQPEQEVNDGGPAFPMPSGDEPRVNTTTHYNEGMSLRAYAAIKLRVPESGIDWLDDMISRAMRDDFAGQVLAGQESLPDERTYNEGRDGTVREWQAKCRREPAIYCYEMATAMQAARIPKPAITEIAAESVEVSDG